MYRRRLFRFTSTLACLLACVSWSAEDRRDTTPRQALRDETPRLVRLVNATVVVSPTRTIENGQLLVDEGRVAAVGKSVPDPDGAIEIDLEGFHVYPGFVDPYTEYGLGHVGRLYERRRGNQPPKYDGDRKGANAWNDAIHAERQWVREFQPDAKAAEALWKRGVTTVQSVKMDGVFRGRGFTASLAEGLPNDLILRSRGPHFASFDKGTSQQSYPSSLMGSIALVRQTLLDADWYARAHAAWTPGSGQSRPEENLALAAVAGNDGAIVFETDDELTLLRAQRIAEEFGLSFVHVGSNREYQRAKQIAALGGTMILPLSFPETPEVGTVEDQLDVSLGQLRRWERAPTNAGVLEQRGTELAFTAQGLRKGEKLLDNLRKAVEHGLSREAALAGLTTVPARLAGVDDQVGTLEKGKRADFLIVAGDLLAGDETIHEVWIDGRRAKRFEVLEKPDFGGVYTMSVDGKALELRVAGEPGKPKGKLYAGDENVDLSSMKTSRTALKFHAKLEDLGLGEGVTRFTLNRVGDDLAGVVGLADGRWIEFEATKTADEAVLDDPKEEKEDAEDSAEEPEETAPTYLSRLTFPNMAYGVETAPETETVLIRNATLWTLEGEGRIAGADMLVEDGKIRRIGQNLDAPRGARVVDAEGKHVTPGMIDEHSHIAISKGVNEGSHAVTAEVRIGDVVNSDDVSIYRALAGGATSAQLLHGSSNPIGGQAQVIKLRWGSPPERMKFAGAPPSIKFALGENVKQSNWGSQNTTRYPQTRMGVETLMRDRFLDAREYAAEMKNASGGVPPRRNLQLEAMAEILAGERFVHCHSYVQSEILMLMRLAEEMGFRIQTFTHVLEGYKVAPEMAAHGAGASTFSDWWAYKFEVYDAIPHNACLMTDAGVITSINSDSSEVVRRLNQEAAKSVTYCDMDEVEALKLASLNPAKQLRIDDRVGSLKAGKDADFVIWSAHPLSVYARAEQTWVDGALLFDRERDREIREADREEKQALVQKILAEGGEKKKGGKGDRGERGMAFEEVFRDWHCEDLVDVWDVEEAR